MKKLLLFTLILSAMMMTACGGDSATEKLVKKLNSSYDYDGKEVELVCYPTIAEHSITLVGNGTVPIYLRNSKWQTSQHAFITTKLNFGKEPNCIWMPEKYTLGDIEIFDSEENSHGINTKLKVKGIVRYTGKDWEKYTIVKEENENPKIKMPKIVGSKSAAERAEEAKQKAEERRKKTGDPNDYSFIFIVSEISAAK